MPTSGTGYSHTVARASGMVSVQASCNIAAAIVLAAMYMLRAISGVLHQEPGPAVPDSARRWPN